MLKTGLFSLLIARVLCEASTPSFHTTAKRKTEHFPWESFKDKTGVDEKDYLNTPAKGVPVTYSCTTKPGPNPVDCSDAFSDWDRQADSNDLLHFDAGDCASLTEGTCEVVVCAPLGALSINKAEIVGRMWNPLSIKCIMGGTGAIYQSDDSEFVVGIARPV
ncbi:hypothetical protein B0T10DRAFT_604399 [Thelonectria olida]|uniref:Uncharacterized protein n=1 Tax=Thelonectria olida TaxID=1576542 RepID=A0A9P8WBG7_9HYPO|nr:hypothetical protein B0T10DRAFT_604399 [Thelonectria olida]